MIIPMIVKVFLYLFQCILTLIMIKGLSSFLEILIFELVLEFFEHAPDSIFDVVVADTTLNAQPVATVDERIPIATFTVWKMCEALDLKSN
ncbi:hypothetical protein TNCT_254581 [Trichonephila clavata]|uniref:Uncharacterized protein n=1 Tax=Trichonephila clavata TaxID=2740835 RepID=A0A8X6G5S1_TRICU|nr:hypothetical protein TNCT_254581 [Trichonephila clavata]